MAFTGCFSNNAIGAVCKALEFDCSESPLRHHAAEDTSKSNKGLSHVFLIIVVTPEAIIASSWPLEQVNPRKNVNKCADTFELRYSGYQKHTSGRTTSKGADH